MKKLKLRIINGCDMTRVCSVRVLGGERGFGQTTNALETFSNFITPTIRTMNNFDCVIIPKKLVDTDGKCK